MPRPSSSHLAVVCTAIAFFAIGAAGGMLLPGPSKPAAIPESTDPTSAPVGDTTRLLADGDLEFGVTRLATSKTGSDRVPADDDGHLREGEGEHFVRADLQVVVASRAARPTLCALPRRGTPPRIAGAILVDTFGTKYPLRQDSGEVSLSAPCESQAPLRAASVSLVFTVPDGAIPHTLLLFDPREPGDTRGLTRLRFPVSAENA